MSNALARTPYARLQQQDANVDREFQKLERQQSGMFVPTALVAARSPYTVKGTDWLILCDCTAGAITLTFPAAPRIDGFFCMVIKTDSSANAVTLSGTFNGVANPTLASQYQSKTINAGNGSYYFVPTISAADVPSGTFPGNYAVAGTLNVAGNFSVNTSKFTVTASTGATTAAGPVTVNNPITGGFPVHDFEVGSTINASIDGQAYASYTTDAQIINGNTKNYNHLAGFQAKMIHNGSGTVSFFYCFNSNPTANGPITTIYHHWAQDAVGTSTVNTQVGLRIESLTKATTNLAIQTAGTTASEFGGSATVGKNGGQLILGPGSPSYTAGSVYRHSTLGLVLGGVTGSVDDVYLAGADGNSVFVVPTGTHNVTFSAGVTVSGALALQGNVGFYNTAVAAKQTVSGSKGGNAALASLMTALSTIGLFTDTTT